MPPRTSGDLTITPTEASLHDVTDEQIIAWMTEGRRVLDVGGVLTTRQERPRLASRPMPKQWKCSKAGGTYEHSTGRTCSMLAHHAAAIACDSRAGLRTVARDLIALIDWLDHEDAVRAQDGGS